MSFFLSININIKTVCIHSLFQAKGEPIWFFLVFLPMKKPMTEFMCGNKELPNWAVILIQIYAFLLKITKSRAGISEVSEVSVIHF